jgi:hypothetical protein
MLPIRKTLLILIFTLLSLSACQPRSGETPTLPAPTGTPPLHPRDMLATFDASFPSAVPPTATALPSETPAPTPTNLPTTTPDPLVAQAQLLGVSWLNQYDLLLSIQFNEPVRAEDYRVVIEEEELYDCEVLEQYPNRLYCIGRGRNVYDRMKVQIFSAFADHPAFEGSLYVPYFTENYWGSDD